MQKDQLILNIISDIEQGIPVLDVLDLLGATDNRKNYVFNICFLIDLSDTVRMEALEALSTELGFTTVEYLQGRFRLLEKFIEAREVIEKRECARLGEPMDVRIQKDLEDNRDEIRDILAELESLKMRRVALVEGSAVYRAAITSLAKADRIKNTDERFARKLVIFKQARAFLSMIASRFQKKTKKSGK